MRALIGAFGALALAGGVAFAASPLEAMQACAATKDDTARLTCYDKAMAAARPAQSQPAAPVHATAPVQPASPATAPAASSTQAARTPAPAQPVGDSSAAPTAGTASATDDFGMTEELRRKRDPERAKREQLAELHAKVVSVKIRQGEALLVELDNGQAWLEIEHRRAMVVGPGESVTLKPGLLGSYFLVLDSGVSSRVRRVR